MATPIYTYKKMTKQRFQLIKKKQTHEIAAYTVARLCLE